MTRDEQTAAIVEHRLAQRRNVINPDTIRGYIKGDLAKLTAAEINREYRKITGETAPEHKPAQYATTELDLATSDALVLLNKPYLDHASIADLLTADYSAAIAGAALSQAIERLEQPAPTPQGVSLADYLATLPEPA